jgi:phenylalanyl-tRNA synthetase beta chain
MLGAGEVVEGIIDIDVRMKESTPVALMLEPEQLNGLLGTSIDKSFMITTLERLGFSICNTGAGNAIVTAPSWRGDIGHYSDLAEEIARFYGYEAIDPTLHSGSPAGAFTPKQKAERQIGQICRAMGYSEICTYSFIGQGDYDKINLPADSHMRKGVVILNPLGEDTSIMRTTSLPSMLGALAKNRSSRNQDARLYEIATVYRDIGEVLPDERPIITLGAYGNVDFFAIKGACETLLREMRVTEVRFTAEHGDPSYHPGRAAAIYSGEIKIGIVGQIHPTVAKDYNLNEDAYAAELDFLLMLDHAAGESAYTPLPRFPSITRDIAIVCDLTVTVAELIGCIKNSGGKLLREVKLFDIYTGNQVQTGKKSVAFSLTLRSDDQTLTDESADKAVAAILAALAAKHGAEIR